jgi:hypothetical protein
MDGEDLDAGPVMPRHSWRRLFQYGNVAAAAAVSGAMLAVLGAGQGAIPALGPALVPGHGAWAVHQTAPPPTRGEHHAKSGGRRTR